MKREMEEAMSHISEEYGYWVYEEQCFIFEEDEFLEYDFNSCSLFEDEENTEPLY